MDEKLSFVIKVIGLSAVKDKPIEEQVRVLDAVGLNSREIGSLPGKDDSTVRHHLSDMRNSKKQVKGASDGKGKKSKAR